MYLQGTRVAVIGEKQTYEELKMSGEDVPERKTEVVSTMKGGRSQIWSIYRKEVA